MGCTMPPRVMMLAWLAIFLCVSDWKAVRAATPETILHSSPGPMPMTRPLRKASVVNISESGTAKPTVALKKMRMSQRMIRLNCATQTWCERGTLTKHMPATKAPSRCEPMSDPG